MLKVFSNEIIAKQENFWNNYHFHPTDAIEDEWGQKIINQACADRVADTVRMYAMFEDIVSMDEQGKLHYDFTLNDQRLDYMTSKGLQVLLSYNFMPPCIAENPEETSSNNKNKTRYKGKVIIISRPKDYALWEEICYQYTKHIVERYGEETVASWYLQCYNEPDEGFFLRVIDGREATQEDRLREYCKLYTHFARGIERVSDKLKFGGPVTVHYWEFFDRFLQYTSQNNIPLKYVSAHIYGTSPMEINDKTNLLSAESPVTYAKKYYEIIRRHYPEGKELVIDEWGASSHGFFNWEQCPTLLFRENEIFSTYYAKMITRLIENDVAPRKMMICLSGQHEMTEDFGGFRNFFTLHFIKKPIYNAYVMLRKLKENRLRSVCTDENTTLLATKDENGNHALLVTYSSENFDQALPPFKGTITVEGVSGQKNVTIFTIDKNHCNPYRLYQKNGFSAQMTEEQLALLRKEGQLVPSAEYTVSADGRLSVEFSLSDNGIALITF